MPCAVIRLATFLIFSLAVSLPETAYAFSLDNPQQIGIAVNLGSSYDPQPTIGFVQLSMMALYDYEQILPHATPEPLRMKFEGSLGVGDDSSFRAMASLNFFACYYLTDLARGSFKPYVEAGAGVAFTDFQVEGQGLRLNFNPQAGIGTEWQSISGQRWFSAIRAHHISNSNLHKDNRGINSLFLQLGFSL